MKSRPDLLAPDSPADLEVIQITTEPDVTGSHVYMEAQVFTPDSGRLIVHRSAHAHGSDKDDPRHQYLLCDIEDNCALSPLTDELGATGPSISPDGQWLYYFANRTTVGGGSLALKRVRLDGTGRETITVVDAPLPGTRYRPSRIYPLSTISSHGQRIAISGFLGDGATEDAPWGLMVFDIETAEVSLIFSGTTWCNIHPQYCRSLDVAHSRDILIQENHDNTADRDGNIERLTGGLGADIHLIRDDGTDFRNLPWGRDGNEFCQGHQCWIGTSNWAITGTSTRDVGEAQLIAGLPAAHAGHIGINTPGAVRNDLSRDFDGPNFYHFATDIAAKRFITDSGPQDGGGGLWLADLGDPRSDPLTNWTYLLNPRCSWGKNCHIHPFLSPDGTMGFFNSDESGMLQAYMVRGF